jgi:hypothetical protein
MTSIRSFTPPGVWMGGFSGSLCIWISGSCIAHTVRMYCTACSMQKSSLQHPNLHHPSLPVPPQRARERTPARRRHLRRHPRRHHSPAIDHSLAAHAFINHPLATHRHPPTLHTPFHTYPPSSTGKRDALSDLSQYHVHPLPLPFASA